MIESIIDAICLLSLGWCLCEIFYMSTSIKRTYERLEELAVTLKIFGVRRDDDTA